MRIDTSKIKRAIVNKVYPDNGEILVHISSDNTLLILRQANGMYPYSAHEWIVEGSTPAKPGDIIIIFEQDTGAVWVNADVYGKKVSSGQRLMNKLFNEELKETEL